MKKIREILLFSLCVLLFSGSLTAAAADGAPIADGNLEACPELGKFLDGLQTLLRGLRKYLIGLIDKIGKSHMG